MDVYFKNDFWYYKPNSVILLLTLAPFSFIITNIQLLVLSSTDLPVWKSVLFNLLTNQVNYSITKSKVLFYYKNIIAFFYQVIIPYVFIK